jgi:hypothetical protein
MMERISLCIEMTLALGVLSSGRNASKRTSAELKGRMAGFLTRSNEM